MVGPALSSIDLPGIPKLRSGKVREVFDLRETLLFVATDRLSAFDVILPDPIPGKAPPEIKFPLFGSGVSRRCAATSLLTTSTRFRRA